MGTIAIVLVWLPVAEVPAREDASASSYNFTEHIGVLAVIVPELKFGQVERQVFRTDIMVSANYAALE